MVKVPVACAAEVETIVYLWPGWTTELDYRVMDIPSGMMDVSIIPECTWPDTGDAEVDNYRIIAAMLLDDLSGIRGLMDIVQWGYGP